MAYPTRMNCLFYVFTVFLILSGNLCSTETNSNLREKGEPISQKKYLEKSRERDTNIIFYGRVLSDEGVPLAGANVTMSYSHFSLAGFWGSGISVISSLTDMKGLFEFKNIKGSSLGLRDIELSGYELLPGFSGNIHSFSYRKGDQSLHIPNKNNPITYNIRKIGLKSFIFNNDRTIDCSVKISEHQIFYFDVFHNARLINEAQINEVLYDVSVNIDYKEKKKCSITFKVRSDNDALLLVNYPFMKNNDKITEKLKVLEFDMGKRWRIDRFLFLKTRSPEFYSRIEMMIDIDEQSCRISMKSSINPYGEMVFEPDHDIPVAFQNDIWNNCMDSLNEGKYADKSLYLKSKEVKKKAK